ncbi:GlcG/HbpS family heme-binding protein [Nitratireductor soli]|uniref:GlcG/HbpS family heme-binding protein n=1 Tax=Nitratireductor soli TaxID=1670619 RepID=UPI00065E2E42|nr:heme-binding protein [Nitratireductor soli]
MFSTRSLGAAIILAATLATAHADTLPTTTYLPLDKAVEAARAAVEACAQKGFAVSAAVVGRDGETTALLRGNGAGPHTAGSATGKAFTSASMGRPSGQLAQAIADNPQLAGLRDMDRRLVILGGGAPVRFDDVLVAGIGVGGAPSGTIDAECAVAGLQAIGAAIPN